VLAGLLLGFSITYVANRAFDRAKVDGINATPVVTKPNECSPKTAVSDSTGTLAQNQPNSPELLRAAAAAKETDLVRAVARGLSKSESSSQAVRPVAEHH
jgi:hypothetical protein